MNDTYNKKKILDILSNLYNNLPKEGYSNLREDILKSANRITKGENPLPIINMLINCLTTIIVDNIGNKILSVIETSNISLKNLVNDYKNGLWINDYASLYGSNLF